MRDQSDWYGGTGPNGADLAPGTHVSKTVAKVISAFEVAMMDLQGQLANAPVVDLLGGAARPAVRHQRLGDGPDRCDADSARDQQSTVGGARFRGEDTVRPVDQHGRAGF